MRLLTCVAVSAVLLALAAPAFGIAQKDIEDCNQDSDLDRMIAGCSRIIGDTSVPPHSQAIAYDRRANAYRKKDNFDLALADYGQAIRLEPQNASLFTDRGIANSHKKDYERAVADFSKAMQLAPSNSPLIGTLMFYRGYALHAQGKYTQAIADYHRAIQLDPKDDSILYNRGYAYLSLKQVDAALSDFEASLRLNPKSAYAIYGRGVSRLRKGDTGGNEDVAAAREINSGIAERIWSGYRVK